MTFFKFEKGGGALRHSNTPLNFWPHKKYFWSAKKNFGVGIFGVGRSKFGIFEASSETDGVYFWRSMV